MTLGRGKGASHLSGCTRLICWGLVWSDKSAGRKVAAGAKPRSPTSHPQPFHLEKQEGIGNGRASQ